jgi:hypothetical protein
MRRRNLFRVNRAVPNATKDGDTFESCNFAQRNPGTPISTLENLKFVHCNLTRCLILPDWTLEDCNPSQYTRAPDSNTVWEEKKERKKRRLYLAVQRALDDRLEVGDPDAFQETAVGDSVVNTILSA